MSDYRIEFPDFPTDDLPAIPAGFVDRSWRNDACPSFVSEELGLTIWIDFADVSRREILDGCRFTLTPSSDNDASTDPVTSDIWAEILDAVEEERATVAGCLNDLAKNDGAVLGWQLDGTRDFDVLVKRGLLRMDGDLYVHPKARKVAETAYTLEPYPAKRVLYVSDNEPATVMPLETLVANFTATGGWYRHYTEADMRDQIEKRGWYEGLHDNGRYLVLDLDEMKLEPHPDHPHNQLTGAR